MICTIRNGVCALACALTVGSTALADVLEVPGEYPTIQSAIVAATDGDEIAVSPGLYMEAINLLGKQVWLYSTHGADETTIDAKAFETSVVTCTSGETPETIIEGFTIGGGKGTLWEQDGTGLVFRLGGGMNIQGSSPTVLDCVFCGNEALMPDGRGFGGGMICFAGGTPTVSGCTFEANRANMGGGMASAYADTLVVDCTFVGNEAIPVDDAWGMGGGAYNESSPTYIGCLFQWNTAEYGGGMANNAYGAEASPELRGCTFIENIAGYSGGAIDNIRNVHESAPTIIGCYFSGNEATWGGTIRNLQADATYINCEIIGGYAVQRGGGMINVVGSFPLLVNVLFADNAAEGTGGAISNENNDGLTSDPQLVNCTLMNNSVVGGGAGGAIRSNGGSTSLANCIVWNNGLLPIFDLGGAHTSVTFSDVEGGFAGVGNIDEDPMCVDPLTGDMALLPGSPCIGAGDDALVPPDEYDLDEDGDTTEPIPYDIDGLGRFFGTVDMGCYEWYAGDINRDGIVDGGDIGLLLGAWGDCDLCPEDLNADGMVDGADLGLLLGEWG